MILEFRFYLKISFLFSCLFLLTYKLSLTQGFLHDLTYPMNNLTLDWGGKVFQLNVTRETVQSENFSYWYQIDEVGSPTHLGTHLDAPCHFAEGKWCVSDIPAERLFSRPGYVIDISSKCALNRNYALNEQDLNSWRQEVGFIEDGAIILVRTGWSRYWPDRHEYFGIQSDDSMRFPGVAPSVAKMFVDFKIFGLGIESPSIDYGGSNDFQTHVMLSRENIFNLENVGPQIAQLPLKDFLVTALPIRIDGASGSPVRIIVHSKCNSGYHPYLAYTLALLGIILIPFTNYMNSIS